MPFNDSFEPRDGEDRLIGVLRESGRLSPTHIYDEMDVNTGSTHHWLHRLHAAGWVARPKKGLYELQYDPREMTDRELAMVYLDHALELDREAVETVVKGDG